MDSTITATVVKKYIEEQVKPTAAAAGAALVKLPSQMPSVNSMSNIFSSWFGVGDKKAYIGYANIDDCNADDEEVEGDDVNEPVARGQTTVESNGAVNVFNKWLKNI